MVYDVIRISFNYRLCVVRHTLQEDHADWFHNSSPDRKLNLLILLSMLFVIHDFFLDPNLGVY